MRLPVLAVFIAFALCGCSSRLPAREYSRSASHALALEEAAATPLGQALAPLAARHPGLSGFALIATGEKALVSRVALIEAASKTLDLQYYSVHDDSSGQLLLDAVLRAADRGVRVRALVDNLNLKHADDILTAMNEHKNIEIRVFNPNGTKEDSWLSRVGAVFTEPERVTRRMHNKVIVADNQGAIAGGRNLGKQYFDAGDDFNFRDMDVLAAGPIVARISRSFDRYWASEEAYPLRSLPLAQPKPGAVERARAALTKARLEAGPQIKQSLAQADLLRMLQKDARPLIWAPGELAVDEPEKIEEPGPMNPEPAQQAEESKPAQRLTRLADGAKSEFLIISPYFVPGDGGVEWLASIVSHGVKTQVLTNSLASTDVAAVHAGYRRDRKALIEKGVDIYEFKPIQEQAKFGGFKGRKSERVSLHSKVYVIDREHVVIGSFNMDPRSVNLNTELAIIIHSPEMGESVAKMFAEAIAPEASYHMELDENGKLFWVTMEKDGPKRYTGEPEASLWRRVISGVFTLLPPLDSQL